MSHDQPPDPLVHFIGGCLWVVAMWLAVAWLVVWLAPW